MAAAQASSTVPLLVAWDKDPAVIGALAAATPSSFVEPVSLQRANTVRACAQGRVVTTPKRGRNLDLHAQLHDDFAVQWKDSTQLQARAYLRHVAKTHKAAALRAEWLAHKSAFARPLATLHSTQPFSTQENSNVLHAPCVNAPKQAKQTLLWRQ